MKNERIIYKNKKSALLVGSAFVLSCLMVYFLYQIATSQNFSIITLLIIFVNVTLLVFCINELDPRAKYILYDDCIHIRNHGNIPYRDIKKVKGSISSIRFHSYYSISIQVAQKKNEITLDCVNEEEFRTLKNKLKHRIKKNR